MWVRGARSGHCARCPGEGEKEENPGGQEEITVEWNMFPNWPVRRYCNVVGRSITHDKSGYDTDARGVEANLPLEDSTLC